jgi:ABC-type glycerol-3-phosphate transport system substrate-binding protein
VKDDLGIDLEISLVEQNNLGAKLKAALPAGTGPDVLATDFDVMGPYWSFMTPLNALGQADWGANWKKDQFTDTAVNEMNLVGDIAGKPGEAMYLPGNMQVLGWPIYWIEDLQKNGIDPSKMSKWDDFTAACDTLKKAGLLALVGASHPATLVDWYQSLVEVTAPGKLEMVERGHGKFSDSDMAEAFNLIAKIHNDYMQPGALGMDAAAAFAIFQTHKGAMCGIFTGTPWFGFLASDTKAIRDQMNNSLGTFLLPGSKGLASMDSGIAMVDGTKNKDAAWAYLKWLSTGKGGAHLASEGEPMGAKALTPTPKGTDFDKNLGAPLYAALQSTNNKFRRILCTDVYQSLTTVIPGVVSKQITAADAGAEVQDAFDKNCGKWVK